MAISPKAQQTLDDLLPNFANELASTDPGFHEYFSNFAFDEVPSQTQLDPKIQHLTLLAALIGCQAQKEFRTALCAALKQGISPVAAKEVTYQAVPYMGFAKVREFIDITNEVLRERGIKLPLPDQSTTDPETRAEAGLKVQKEIFGAENIDNLNSSFPEELQHIGRFLSANCFGDNYTRNGLDMPTRELLTFCYLIAHGGCDSQAKSHAAGNFNVGNTRELLIKVTTQLLPYIGYPRTLNAINAINGAAGK